MTTYTLADESIDRFVNGIMKYHHSDLARAGVTVEILMASNDEGPAVMHNGYPAAAVMRKMSLKDRAAGNCDSRLIIDSEWWEKHDKAERSALIDHELYHLELVTEKDSMVIKRDDLERPVLRIRKHDFQIGGFYHICERHKAAAAEGQYLACVKSKLTQMEFPWDQAELAAAMGSETEAAAA